MSASATCPHSDLHFEHRVNLMVDSNVHSLDLRVRCNICGARMHLSRGLPMGATSHGPTRSIDDTGDTLGILIPFIAEGEEPTKEWGVTLSGPHLVAI